MSFMMLAAKRRAGGASDIGALVAAILSGTAGFAFDPIVANLFQDTVGATPVVIAADPVGRINCQWGSAPPNWQQATAGYRPAWDGTGVACDGVDDHMATLSGGGSLLNNVPGAFACKRVLCTDLVSSRPVFSFSTATSTIQRFCALINTNGSIALQCRRLDADSLNTITTASTGLITAGVAATISWQVDYAGTGLAKIWLNGTEVASAAIAGVAGNSDVTNTNRARLMAGLAAVPPTQSLLGWVRRGVMTPYVLNDADRATMEAWVGEV